MKQEKTSYKPHALGKDGEELAIAYLRKHDYTIKHVNWREGKLELDIVAEKDDLLVIVEVKTRSTDYFGEPEHFVTIKKQRLIIKATNLLLKKDNIDKEVRFDIISIVFGEGEPKITHFERAFYPLA